MCRQQFGFLVLVTVVTLSGCSMLDGGSEPASVTETINQPESSTSTDRPLALPSVIRVDGSVNGTRLLSRYVNASQGNGTKVTRERNGSTITMYWHGNESIARDGDKTTWVDGHLTVTNDTKDDGDDYSLEFVNRGVGTGGGAPADQGLLLALGVRFGLAEYRHVGTTTANGRLYHELNLVGSRVDIGEYTGTLLVDERGRPHRLAGRIGENESLAERFRYDFEYDGREVPKPEWLEHVHRGRATTTANGTVFAQTLTGGPRIDEGTNYTFRNGTTTRTGTLDAPLYPGETLYLAMADTGDGNRSLVSSREPIDRTELIHLEGSLTSFRATSTVDGNRTVDVSFKTGWRV